MLLAGGVVVLVALAILPVPDTVDRGSSLAAGAFAVTLGSGVLVSHRRLPAWSIPALLAAATVIVSVGLRSWRTSSGDDTMFYVWIALYAAYFFPWPLAALELAIVGGCYGAVLARQGIGAAAITRWTVTMTTLAVAAAVIARLVRRLRRAVRDLEAAAAKREQLVRQLEKAALTDALTGLPNRRMWNELFARELARASRDELPITVALLDLDHFKAYNDHHGHSAGDRLLQHATAAWRSGLRASDVLARYGGEEFALLLPACGAEASRALVERLRAATPPVVTASAGIAVWDGCETSAELVDRADRALYAAKAAGRDCCVSAELPLAA